MAKSTSTSGIVPRDPDRTRARILAAALKEFSDRGFAGARVDAIARRARVNKRMLYHYFKHKEGLFRAVLRKKINERQAWAEASSGNPEETLPFWFEVACKDADWVRLLEWEALQGNAQKPVDEKERRVAVQQSLKRIKQRQARGQLSAEFDPRHIMLTIRSLTIFPVAFPQLTRLIIGRSVDDPKFVRERAEFLRQFARVFRPRHAR